MPDLYSVCVQAVAGPHLTCRVTAHCDHEGYGLPVSPALAFGFLWDTTDWAWWMRCRPDNVSLDKEALCALAKSTSLGRALARYDLGAFDSAVWRTCADQFVSCVGVTDRSLCDLAADDETRLLAEPQATYHIAVPDPRWLEHLSPGTEWTSWMSGGERSGAYDPAWLTSDVLALARGISAELAFERLPILADALQDAGCTDEDLLAHCRAPGPHAPGCWAVGLLLRDPFDPRRLERGTIRLVRIHLTGTKAGAMLDPDLDRASIAELVEVVRSARETLDRAGLDRPGVAQGTMSFQIWGQGIDWDEVRFLPGGDGCYYLRAGGRGYRVSRTQFVSALRQAGVKLPE